MTDLERGPSSDGTPSMHASSLNKPSSQEGLKLVERLREDVRQLRKMADACAFSGFETGVRVKDPSALLADLLEAATLISELQAETERLSRELDTSNNNHRSMAKTLAEAGERALAAESALYLEKNKSDNLEQNYHEATTRHPSFNDAIEAAAKVADDHTPTKFEGALASHVTGKVIAAAIRSLKLPDYRGGEAKTAESENSPSTLNAETE